MSIFIQNKYHSWYYNITNSAKSQERLKLKRNDPLYVYYENHHIIPKALGGSNSKDNLVLLTAREHFICHILLTKMLNINSPEYYKMIRAAQGMKRGSSKGCRYVNSRLYNTVRSEFSKHQAISQSGKGNSQYGKHKSSKHIDKLRSNALRRHGISRRFNILTRKKYSVNKLSNNKILHQTNNQNNNQIKAHQILDFIEQHHIESVSKLIRLGFYTEYSYPSKLTGMLKRYALDRYKNLIKPRFTGKTTNRKMVPTVEFESTLLSF